MSQTHVIASTDNVVYVWHYRTSSRLAAPEFNAIVSHALETHDRSVCPSICMYHMTVCMYHMTGLCPSICMYVCIT